MSGESQKELMLKAKYAELPSEPKYKKKKTKKKIKRADHKHMYVPCYFDYKICTYKDHKKIRSYAVGTYCFICGRIGNYSWSNIPIEEANPDWPVFERELLDMNKYV